MHRISIVIPILFFPANVCIFHVNCWSKPIIYNLNTTAKNIDFICSLYSYTEGEPAPFLLKPTPSHISFMHTHGPQQMVQMGERGRESQRVFAPAPQSTAHWLSGPSPTKR